MHVHLCHVNKDPDVTLLHCNVHSSADWDVSKVLVIAQLDAQILFKVFIYL